MGLFTLLLLAPAAATSDSEARASPWLLQVLDFLGVSATPSNLKGETQPGAGELWVADLTTGVRLRFAHGPYRSPIFLSNGQAILALSGNNLMQIHQLGAEPTLLATIPGVIKLVGAHREDPNRLLVLITDADGEAIRPAAFNLQERRVLPSPPHENRMDQRLIPHLLGNDRQYGDTRLFVRDEQGKVEGDLRAWTEVFIETLDGGEARNISRCKPASCLQPSLAPDELRVVYVKRTDH